MNPPLPRWITPLFVAAALYDLVLGGIALVAFRPIMTGLGIEPPNHDAYVQFGSAVVIVFGIGFAMAARDPRAHRGIIALGVLFKLAYALPILYHFFFGSIPMVWTWFAWTDLVFAAVFVVALRAVGSADALQKPRAD